MLSPISNVALQLAALQLALALLLLALDLPPEQPESSPHSPGPVLPLLRHYLP
jgi:hypothetical protein